MLSDLLAPDTSLSSMPAPSTDLPTLPALTAQQLRRHIDPASLGFASTAELGDPAPGWIGQHRARQATEFGLHIQAPDYNLFVLGEVGSGRSSLLRQALHQAAQARPVPPDLGYLHRFEAPQRPLALRLPAGTGRLLRQGLQQLTRQLAADIPAQLEAAEVTLEADGIEKAFEREEHLALKNLEALAARHGYQLQRESDRLKLVLPDKPHGKDKDKPHPSEADKAAAEALATATENEVRAEMARVLAQLRLREIARDEALEALKRRTLTPQLQKAFDTALAGLPEAERSGLQAWVQAAIAEVLNQIDLFRPLAEDEDEADRKADLAHWQHCLAFNLVVDHAEQQGAPVVLDNNPQMRSLFGSIEHPGGDDAGPADHTAIHAGGLLQAHGGYLMLHLADLIDDEPLWERLRRFLRSRQLQIEEPGGTGTPAGASLQPDAVPVDVRLVLIGSPDEYYKLQDADPEMARRFRVKVDFADRFAASDENRHAMAAWVACRCRQLGLPHFEAAGVAALLEQSHREADDQHYLSAQLGQIEMALIESAQQCRDRQGALVSAADVAAALQARRQRHDYLEQCVLDSISEGERLISTTGLAVGQLNAMSQIDTGDHRFGVPMRISARTQAGHQGVLNIEREVRLSGPIHDKGVLILQGYLHALFSDQAPLALQASLGFEQEYDGVEGDSASCAELFALLSSLSGVGLRQDIAVTGALNQHGEVLPVGGLNEKIEGWFQVCRRAGLSGRQGVLLPALNQRQLMLSPELVAAVAAGQFHVYTMRQASEGLGLLAGQPASEVHALAADTLAAYRRAYRRALRPGRGGR